MYIFISYPRSISEKAERIDSILATGGYRYDIFLDKQSLSPENVWRQKISESIKKAEIYLVLIDKKSTNEGGYFEVEIEEIKNERRKSFNKEIIPVLFNSKDTKDVPIFFQNFSVIIADDKDNIWTNKVIKSIEEIEERHKPSFFEKLKIFISKNKTMFLFILVMALLLNIFLFSPSFKLFEDKGLYECDKIRTKRSFVLDDPYWYVLNVPYKDIYSYKAESFQAETSVAKDMCEKSGKDEYSLSMNEYTRQRITIKNDNDNTEIYIGISENRHPSTLFFNNNGLYKRTYNIPEPDKISAYCDNKEAVDKIYGKGQCEKIMEDYKIESIKKHLNNNHEKNSCNASFEERNDNSYINSRCNNYSRLMKG